jgi:PAS domain S-box-containing protein
MPGLHTSIRLMVLKNNLHRIVYANDAYVQMTGYTREELIGKSPKDFFEHDPEQERRLLASIIDNHKHCDVTCEKRADGSDVVSEGDYAALYDEETGLLTGIFGVQNDITLQLSTTIHGTDLFPTLCSSSSMLKPCSIPMM